MQIRKNLYILRGSQLRREYTQVQIRKNQVQTLRREYTQVHVRKKSGANTETGVCSGANKKESEYTQVQPIERRVCSGANQKSKYAQEQIKKSEYAQVQIRNQNMLWCK